MATLIPARSACVSRMTAGERRLAERLEHKLDSDYLVWYDVPVGPRYAHPEVALADVGHMPTEGKDEKDEARLFYVAATCATHRLVITASGDGGFGRRLG